MAAKQINYHVMGYYPITPSTEIAETLDAMKAEGEHNIRMIPGDGEHGAAGVCFGATTAGGRVFNATSANGLLFALEQLPVQSGTRFPMGFNIVTRAAYGPPHSSAAVVFSRVGGLSGPLRALSPPAARPVAPRKPVTIGPYMNDPDLI